MEAHNPASISSNHGGSASSRPMPLPSQDVRNEPLITRDGRPYTNPYQLHHDHQTTADMQSNQANQIDQPNQAYDAALDYNSTLASPGNHWYFNFTVVAPPDSAISTTPEMTPRERADARLAQLTANKKMINEQRGFIRAQIKLMEARLEEIEAINADTMHPNSKLAEQYNVEAALDKADEDMNETARLWDHITVEYEELMAEVAVGEHGN